MQVATTDTVSNGTGLHTCGWRGGIRGGHGEGKGEGEGEVKGEGRETLLGTYAPDCDINGNQKRNL